MGEKPLADTPLAHWLNDAMAAWVDLDTGNRGLSGNRLAALSGLSQTLVFEILKEKTTTPKLETLVKLANFFDVSPVYLVQLILKLDDKDLSLEMQVQFVELEKVVGEVPPDVQLQFMQNIVSQAEMLQAASLEWAKVRA